ncbi:MULTISPECIES: GatB/YqeY domain-containing protein [unclassified Rhizobium]|uniref:GatB/YqeY domain-containing protein n=1 Tax=unclassified Rhizobium TaxID=2613769 RepID=UPI0006FB3D3E|nr:MULTISPECIES: GatB/YqeY domain-containing protein [unclassified Rhizobium]KQV38345.1 glutamyl-tRNA amidotransferase [Rhizobium sp. Root1212]KRD31000.1 glutamyl-tRNA amidotransferase [Rhizobium sp. Root268]
MRETINEALKTAMKAKEARRVSTLRLVQAAIKERDIANRGVGKDAASDDEVLQILAKMVKQREESAKIYEDAGRPELAAQEREEIAIIAGFQPEQFSEEKVRAVTAEVIAEVGAQGIRDMGKCMAVLKERYAGQMDFAKASAVLKELLSAL